MDASYRALPRRRTDAADVALGALGDWLTRTTGVRGWSCNPSVQTDEKIKKQRKKKNNDAIF